MLHATNKQQLNRKYIYMKFKMFQHISEYVGVVLFYLVAGIFEMAIEEPEYTLCTKFVLIQKQKCVSGLENPLSSP